MKPDDRHQRKDVSSSLFWLRLMFFGLTFACVMQVAYDAGSIIPACEPVYYLVDRDRSSNPRPHDPDSPFPKSIPKIALNPAQDLDVDQNLKAMEMDKESTEPPPQPPIPRMVIDPLYHQEQKKIDEGISDEMRCARYGVEVLPEDEKNTRRIFFGAMLANENPEVIAAHAIEVYNKYHLIALVESNTTHSVTPRKMNYGPGSFNARMLQESEMFGIASQTKVIIDYWLEDKPFLYEMTREVEQRNTIWKIWVEQGMTERDIGIMADLDEVVSRDFLNALQLCDFPKLRHDPANRPSCQVPKMPLASVQFEGSPLCIKKFEWYHPDLILGNCIEGVGDPSGRVTPQRDIAEEGSDVKRYGYRTAEWGRFDYKKYPKDVIENNRFPLWDGRDIREINGSDQDLTNRVKRKGMGKNAVYGASYHLHNWFTDTEVLRHKFTTYGHPDELAKTAPLSEFGDGDINMMVRCVRDLGNDIKITNLPESKTDPNRYEYYLNNTVLPEGSKTMFSLGGNRPIFFSNRAYVLERHALLQKIILADEEKYGTVYTESTIRAFEESQKKEVTQNSGVDSSLPSVNT